MDSPETKSEFGVTEYLGNWTAGMKREHIPDRVWQHAKLCLLDALGCALYGSKQPWGRISAEVALELSPSGPASLWGSGHRCGVDAAAMANGTAMHGFELDDVHLKAITHLGAVTVPAAFALAEAYGKSPTDLLTAVIAGYEVGARVGMAAGLNHSLRGYHTVGTVGSIAASASAARVMGLSAEATTDALGTGATQASGLHGARMGAMTKRFHAGRAAQSGVLAALLAQRGFTGSHTALEQPSGGFFSTLCGDVDMPVAYSELGTRWETLEVGFKAYASCASTHTTIDAVDRLLKRGVTVNNLAQLRIGLSRKGFSNVGWKYVPASVLAAQMNAHYTAAIMLLDGAAFVDQFTESRIADPAVMKLIEKITIRHDPALDVGGAATRHAACVEAQLNDNTVLFEKVEQRRGSSHHPLTREEIEVKFRHLAQSQLTPDAANKLVALVDELDALPNLKPIGDLMRGADSENSRRSITKTKARSSLRA